MRPLHEQLAGRLLHKLANQLAARPRWFVWPQLILLAITIAYTATNLKFNTSRSDLVSNDEQYQRAQLLLQKEFKVQNSIVAIVESENPDKNRQFVERLAFRLRGEPELFTDVLYRGDLKMMGPKALLFLAPETLDELNSALREYAPLFETFSQVDSLEALVALMNNQLRQAGAAGNTNQQLALARAVPVLRRVVDECARTVTGNNATPAPGITALFGGRQNLYLTFASNQIYAVLAQAPSEALEGRAVQRMREMVRATQAEVPGVNAGITGEPVLKHDEMVQAQRDVHLAALLSLVLVAVIFIAGYREIRRPIYATLCLLVGIGFTLGFATITVGHLNVLSITLVPILIGLAIDFGVHLISRYEEELRAGKRPAAAMHNALVFSGIGIFNSGFTTAGAFLAMMLTQFKGVREMGLISGVGLLVCLVPMMTLLPLLLVHGGRELPDEAARRRFSKRAEIEQVWLQRPRLVLICGTILTVIAIGQLPKLQFDYNLLHLQMRGLEAVHLGQKLTQSGSKSMLSALVVANSLDEAAALEKRLVSLPTVAGVNSVVKALTEDQSVKLAALREIKERVGQIRIPPASYEPVDVLRLDRNLSGLSMALGFAANKIRTDLRDEPLAGQVIDLRNAIEHLRRLIDEQPNYASARLSALQTSLLNDLRETLSLIQAQDATSRMTAQDIPAFLRERFISKSGKFLLEVYPRGDIWQRNTQKAFVEQVREVAPDVTGSPVQIYEYTSLVKESFQKAGAYAAAVIAIMVLLHFRRPGSVLLAFLPVALGFLWMLGLMVLLHIPFNPVNIMSLTLVIGIGVTNSIHILNRFAEHANPKIMATSTGKAVLVSALNTIAGFGSLLIAKHQGISSLGAVMAIGTGTCMLASLTVLPAVLNQLNELGWTMTKERRLKQPARPRPNA